MQRLIRRPSSCGDAERSRRPRVDLHAVEVVDAAAPQRGLPVGVLLHPDDGRATTRRTAAPGACPSCTVHERISPFVTETTTSIASSRARRHEQRLDLAVDGRARFVREHDGLVAARAGARARTRRRPRSGRRRRSTATARRISSAVSASSGCAAAVIQPPAALLAHVLGGPGDEAFDVVRLPGDELLEVLGDVHLERAAVERVERRRRRARRR